MGFSLQRMSFLPMLQTLRTAGLKLRRRDPKYNEHSASRYKDTSSNLAQWLASLLPLVE
jgi:hypothetical protein